MTSSSPMTEGRRSSRGSAKTSSRPLIRVLRSRVRENRAQVPVCQLDGHPHLHHASETLLHLLALLQDRCDPSLRVGQPGAQAALMGQVKQGAAFTLRPAQRVLADHPNGGEPHIHGRLAVVAIGQKEIRLHDVSGDVQVFFHPRQDPHALAVEQGSRRLISHQSRGNDLIEELKRGQILQRLVIGADDPQQPAPLLAPAVLSHHGAPARNFRMKPTRRRVRWDQGHLPIQIGRMDGFVRRFWRGCETGAQAVPRRFAHREHGGAAVFEVQSVRHGNESCGFGLVRADGPASRSPWRHRAGWFRPLRSSRCRATAARSSPRGLRRHCAPRRGEPRR
jgi:hypothetical protein